MSEDGLDRGFDGGINGTKLTVGDLFPQQGFGRCSEGGRHKGNLSWTPGEARDSWGALNIPLGFVCCVRPHNLLEGGERLAGWWSEERTKPPECGRFMTTCGQRPGWARETAVAGLGRFAADWRTWTSRAPRVAGRGITGMQLF